jgi:pyruvate dehydrogenase E2 component (dihydrolipoamide acetyltransferase)
MDFLMPKLSDTMEEGTVLQWLKANGDAVAKGEPIVEIETDKANMMVEAPDSGTLTIVAQVGDSLPIGAPIATIGAAGAAPTPASAPATEPTPVAAPTPAAKGDEGDDETTGIPTADDGTGSSIGLEVTAPEAYPGAAETDLHPTTAEPISPEVAAAPAGATGGDGEVRASPLARRLAGELGVDLAQVHGTGPAGRIVREDVEAAAAASQSPTPAAAPTAAPPAPPIPAAAAPAAPPAPSTPGERTPLTRLQKTIAKRMAESKPGAPHFYLQRDIDVTALLALRKELVAASPEGQGPSVNDLIVRAVAMASAERPDAVSRFDGDALVAPSGIHIGIAVAVPGGLLVPVIRSADTLRVAEIAAQSRGLAGRCRDGTITPPELEGSVISVSNLGMFGIDRFLAVLNPPEAAILAVGRAKPGAVVVDGAVVVRDVLTLTLSVDHRAVYGAEAATFLGRIAELLERPGALVL